MKTTEQQQFYALIDNGKFSGKPKFVYSISANKDILREQLKNNIGNYIITISKEEYDYMGKVPECFDIGYFEGGKTIQSKFYY